MITETIKYFDYNGNERTEQCCFNLSKAECMEMELGTEGGMQQLVEKIVNEKDNKRLVEIFKQIILKSYGEKSPDGKYFRKSEEIANNFAATEAYSELFMKLATDAEYAAKFVNGILPDLSKEEAKTAEFTKAVIPMNPSANKG